MRPVILLVHGTFAPNAPWTRPDSLLCQQLRTHLNDPDIRSIPWSGRNTFVARTQAGECIAEAVQSIPSDVPVAIICHSHGGSAVAYGAKAHPDAFRGVRTVVCLATPFFGVSVRPGYQALVLASLVALFFFLFQSLFLVLTAVITEHDSAFADQPYVMVAIGLGMLGGLATIAGALWTQRIRLFRSFESAVRRADGWDTTKASLPNPLFVRSMGDEVGLSLATLQFAATAVNKILNLLSRVVSRMLEGIRAAMVGLHGAVAIIASTALLIAASGLPAVLAATFGYHPHYWADVLNPWSRGFNIVDPEFGVADHIARVIYALTLLALAMAYAFMLATALLTLTAVFLSWIATVAFGCSSLRLAIAAELAVEPTPEGLHTFLNGGWSRNVEELRNDRPLLQHSEPYGSHAMLDIVVAHIAAHLAPAVLPCRTQSR
jgi:hypothetical protein